MDRILSAAAVEKVGETVRLAGWVHNLRSFREVRFLILRDRGGLIQTVATPESGVDLETIGKEYVVELEGEVVADPRAPGGVEVKLSSAKVLATAEEPPLEINRPAVMAKTHLDKVLDHRPISLRALPVRAIFTVQARIVQAFGEYLRSQGFTEFKSSKIVGTGTEGGANVFEIDYLGRPAFLAQSPQFYKQIMVGSGLERVFEVGPVYRAEKHETSRHLNEYTSLDFEMGFIESEQDVIAMHTEVIRHICREVAEHCATEVELLGADIPQFEGPIPQIEFADGLEIVKASGHDVHGGDLDPEGERRLSAWAREEHGADFLFVTAYPLSHRPMYTGFREDDPAISKSFDLLCRGLEITTGSQRIHEHEVLARRMREHGVDPAMYESYLSAFLHGMPPHGGLGLGLERLTMQLLGLRNVKAATLFPRDRNRLDP